jgi:hypothetical protein
MAENEHVPLESDSPPEVVEEPAEASKKPVGRWQTWKNWYSERKKWTVPLTVLVLLLILAGIPFTRYHLAGLALKRDFSLRLVDSTSNTPVSGATVTLGGQTAESDASGKVTLHVGVGNHKFEVSKKYYAPADASLLVPILKQKQVPDVKMSATGRQVRISVANLISKQALGGVDIKVADISAKTDKNGDATVVLPAGVSTQSATLSLNGYNDAKVTVKVSSDKVQQNDFTLTPAGQVYFLSNLSGKIDVVKTNLDGTDRQTVLAGTGSEDDNNTVLLASRDWKYLALLARRAGNSPSLYLINTSDDSLSTIDEGNADFNLTGWVDDNFVYTVTRNNISLWQDSRQAVKSFNAPTKKLTTLDQTTASGSNNFDYVTQTIGGVYAYDDLVYYIMNWSSSYYGGTSLSDKQATFNSVKPDGTAKKAIKSFGLAPGTSAIDVSLDQRIENPDKIDLHFADGTKDNFYVYSDGQVKPSSSLNDDNFYTRDYPTYLQSPSGGNTFWSEARDGKNTLFIGDEDGQGGKQIATLSDYNTYGWYTDNYLLVSKNSSELYVMPKNGSQPAVKISDYHKPVISFPGYGGGYGGF